jgi:hypothetical protein
MKSIDNGPFQELSASELNRVDGGMWQGVLVFFLSYYAKKALDGLDDGSPSLADMAGYK